MPAVHKIPSGTRMLSALRLIMMIWWFIWKIICKIKEYIKLAPHLPVIAWICPSSGRVYIWPQRVIKKAPYSPSTDNTVLIYKYILDFFHKKRNIPQDSTRLYQVWKMFHGAGSSFLYFSQNKYTIILKHDFYLLLI